MFDEKIILTHEIEIKKDVTTVYAYLLDIEKRLRLNPSYELIRFKKNYDDKPKEGSSYLVTARRDEEIFSYTGVIKELKPNELMVTEDSEGRLRVTFNLMPTPNGTKLAYREEFFLDPGYFIPNENSWVAKILLLLAYSYKLFSLPKAIQLKSELLNKAILWLNRIKDDIEKNY